MANMSYCRFENTLGDFDDCADVVEEIINGDSSEELSREEFRAAIHLIESAANLVALLKEAAGVDADDDLTREEIEQLLTIKQES